MLITSHILCRISTHDVLKKYKLKDTDIETVSKKMINVFLCFIAISIVISIIVLYVSIMYESKLQSYEILLATQKYQEHYNVDFLNTIINEILSNFYTYRSNVIAYTFITELGFCVSLIAIAPFQKIMIKKYNS